MKTRYLMQNLCCVFFLMATGTVPVYAADEGPDERYIDFGKETPSGTVEFEAKQMALIVGGGWGSGTLRYQGKDHTFKIAGLKAGGVGYSQLDVSGEVYFLNTLDDFPGKYGEIALGATAVKGGVHASVQNSKGVVLRLKAKSKGVALNLGVGGLSIKFEE